MVIAGIPTRGLVFARSIESVLANQPDEVVFSIGQPIPDCFNYLRQEAIDRGADLWIVEEDVVVEPNTLQKLINLEVDIATVDYNLQGGRRCVGRHPSGYIYAGTGCTLIKNQVLKTVGEFRTTHKWPLNNLQPYEHNKKTPYGLHDIDYYMRAQFDNFTVGVADSDIKHLRLIEKGESRTNNGVHTIEEIKDV